LENDWIGLLLFPFLVGLVISYLLLGVTAAGAVVNSVTAGAFPSLGWFAPSGHAVPAPLASAAVCGVVLAYVFFGGMRGTAWANAFQTTVFMVLGVVTFVVIANSLGGSDRLWENLRRATQAVPEAQFTRARIPPPVYFSFLFIPLSVAMFPHIFQHWLTARSAEAFKLPIVLYPVFIMIVWLPCVLLGIWASGAGSGVPPGTPENRVLALLVQQHAGPWLGGLLTAGILAAIMSSLDSQFLCLGTMFTEDVVLHYGGAERFTDRGVVLLARLFVVLVVLVTYLLSLFPRAVFDLGLWSFSGFAGLFPLIWAALYWRRLTAAGALASVLATLATWSVLFYRSGFGRDPLYTFPEALRDGPQPWWCPCLLPVVAIIVVSATTLVLVSRFTRPPNAATLAKFFRD
jgi:SSS family solute:Na+ symporter